MSDHSPPPPPEPPESDPPAGPFARAGTSEPAQPKKAWWKRWWGVTLIVFALLVVIIAIVDPADEEPDTAAAEGPTEEAAEEPAEAPVEEGPAEEPAPEAAEEPEPEPEPEPDPVEEDEFVWPEFTIEPISGSGDDFVLLDTPITLAGTVAVTGNSDARFFAVRPVDEDGEPLRSLVSTTEPYDGLRPLAFTDDVHGFEVEATGSWTITIRSLNDARMLEAGGSIEGDSDDVLLVDIDGLTVANIVGNEQERFFAIRAWNGGRGSVVSTTDAYDGTVRIPPDTLILDIEAVGPWSIDLE